MFLELFYDFCYKYTDTLKVYNTRWFNRKTCLISLKQEDYKLKEHRVIKYLSDVIDTSSYPSHVKLETCIHSSLFTFCFVFI